MRKTDIYIGIITVIVLAAFGIAGLFLPDREISAKENRYLSQAPALSWRDLHSGKWGEDAERYLSDQFPFRELLVGVKNGFEHYALRRKELNGVYVTKDRLIPRNKEADSAALDRNLRSLSALSVRCDAPVSIIMPYSPAYAMRELLPRHAPYYDESKTAELVAGLENIEKIHYYKTDHHWSMLGANYVCTQFISSLGMSPVALEEQELLSEDFRGTSYAKAGLWSFPAERLELYSPHGGYKAKMDGGSMFRPEKLEEYDKYAYFLGGNAAVRRIEGGAENDLRLVIVADSYAHNAVPILSLYFGKILLLDPRYIGSDPYLLINEFNPDNILVLMSAGSIGQESGLSLFLRY